MPIPGPRCGACVSSRADDERPDVVPLGGGRYQLNDRGARRVAFAITARDTWVFLDGRIFVVPAAEGTARRVSTDDDAALMAPMPATVVSVHVSAGQDVARDEVLVTLEAMKMELPIKAPRAGRVTAVTCREGELVQPGVRLMEIEYGS
jgi:acetyl/propionyl-CoA carboxylase alpha subunit